LHPVQFYEALALFAIFALLLFQLPRRDRSLAPDGDLAATFLFLYGITLYFLDLYRGNRSFVFHEILSATQLLAIGLVLAGAALAMRRKPAAR
jgi:prolipoprotein diacylglyceryltransferase